MALPPTVRLVIPALAVGGLLLASRSMDRADGSSTAANPNAGLPPQAIAVGRFAFEAPMTLLPEDMSQRQQATWVPPFAAVSRYGGFDETLSVSALRGYGLADTTLDLSRVPQAMLDGVRGPDGERVAGRAEPATFDGRPGFRLRGRFEGGKIRAALDGVAVRAGDEYLVVIVMGPPDRVQATTDHVVQTLTLR